jgi:hypothetical protein
MYRLHNVFKSNQKAEFLKGSRGFLLAKKGFPALRALQHLHARRLSSPLPSPDVNKIQ